MRHAFSPRPAALLSLFAVCATVPASSFAAPVKPTSDEFAILAPGDPIYAHLKTIAGAGWTARAWNPGLEATRSEAALEAARLIFSVTARARADATWTRTASRPAARALHLLILALRPELAQLGVETRDTLALLERVSSTKAVAPAAPVAPRESEPPVLGGAEVEAQPSPATPVAPGLSPAPFRFGGRAQTPPRAAPFAGTPLEGRLAAASPALSLGQKLRVTTAVQALAGEASDPFRGHGGDARSVFAAWPREDVGSARTGAALNLSPWLTLRAAYARQRLTRPSWGLRNGLLNGLPRQSTLGGGVDVGLGSLTFSGDIAHLNTPDAALDAGLQVSGGVRFSAWQKRLTLGANLSVLHPEDSLALASTAAQFDVGIDVAEGVSLKLLYQNLFSASSTQRPDRFVGGGISLSF